MLQRNKWLIVIAAISAAIYYKRSFMFYGLLSRDQLEHTIDKVVSVLGGGVPAKKLLLETAAAETDLGKAIDTSWNVGIGIMQFDKIGFDDVKQRTSAAKKALIERTFGIDIDRVEYTDLRWNPLLSVIFARLKYLLVPGAIPDTIQGRAAYWKKWYNSELGAGTPEHYIDMAAKNELV